MRTFDFMRPAVVAALVAPAVAGAQQQEAVVVSGKVTGENGIGLFGATVAIPALNIGTQTDDKGSYRLIVPAARVRGQQVALEVRRVGYKPRTQLITLVAGTPITRDFPLETNPLRLGEVVVTGAGTLSSTEKLGNARSQVDSTTITRSNELNVVQALASKAPGVQINAQSGQPGASSGIQIRGAKTITGTSQPLFVVDGQPIDNRTSSTQGFLGGTDTPNRASDINPADIESIEILKGAAASAIYGARAAAGVVLITTKSGKGGPTRVTYRTTYSSDQVLNGVPLQREFGQGNAGRSTVPSGTLSLPLGTNDALSFGPRLAPGTQTYDQFGTVFTNGSTLDQQLQISGGNERTTFFLSGGYADMKGIVVGDNDEYQRTTIRVNASHKVVEPLTIKANVSYVDVGGSFVQRGSNVSGLLLGALRTPPEFDNRRYLDPATGFHRSYRFPNPTAAQRTGSRGFDNPVFSAMTTAQPNDVGRVFGNITADYTPLSWLRLNYVLGTDYSSDERTVGFPMGSSTNNGLGQIIRWTLNSRQLDHNLTATATKSFSRDYEGSFTIGQNLNERRFTQVFVQADNLIAPAPFRIANTQNRQVPSDAETLQRIESYFAQGTFDLWQQLYLTAALRRDGNSAYGEENQYAVFPKYSAAWNFLKGDGTSNWGWQSALRTGGILTFGKLRYSYGEAGAEPAPYQLQSVFIAGGTFGDGGWGSSVTAVQNGQSALFRSATAGNPFIGPERTKEWEYGVDLGLFNDRVDLAYTRYTSRSEDVIFPSPVPASIGFTQQAQNAALIRNRGVEISLNTRPVRRGGFELDLGGNWSFNDNNVLRIAQEFTNINGSFAGNEAVVVRGGRVGMIAGFDFARCGRGLTIGGVNIDEACGAGAPAGALYIGPNGFPIQDPTRRVVGDPQPDWIAGLNGTARYKKFSVSGFLDIRKGGDIWNGTRGSLVAYGTAQETAIRGQTRTFGTDFYAQPVAGPGAGRAVVIDQGWFGGLGGGFGVVNRQFIEDGSFVRLREVSLGYTWDNAIIKGLGIGSADIRLSGRNLALWTDYKGIDPETNLAGAEVAARGIDFFNMPMTRSYVFSVSLTR